MSGVLSHITVVEFTHMVAGPACGMVLGDLGAKVIKVEPPQGDITRRIGPTIGGHGALFASTNRNKQAVCLDITDAADAMEAVELAASAHVVVSNLDAAMLVRAGLDPATLRARNPRLIYVMITGFGPLGPAGTDGLAQAAMGMMAASGPVEGPGYRTGPSVVDVSTGVWAALGVFAALENLRQTGKGDLIQASLADTCLYMQYPHVTMHAASPETVRRNGNHSVVSCTPMFEAADGRLMATVLHERHWRALCRVAGVPALGESPEFDTNEKRCAAQSDIEARLNPLMRSKTRAEWVEMLRAEKLPCAPERTYAEIETDCELLDRGMLFRLPEGEGGSLQTRLPLQFNSLRFAEMSAPPNQASRKREATQ